MWNIYLQEPGQSTPDLDSQKGSTVTHNLGKPDLAFSPPPKGSPHAAQPIFPQL